MRLPRLSSRSHQRRVRQAHPYVSLGPFEHVSQAYHHEQAGQWRVGLEAIRHFQQLFPDVYLPHVAPLPLLPATVVHVCESFLGLAGLVVDMDYSVELPNHARYSPLDYLLHEDLGPDPANANWLLHLVELQADLAMPSPVCYGVGLQLYFDEGMHEPRLLTMAIWRLIQATGWSVGFDFADIIEGWIGTAEDGNGANANSLMALKPIPANTSMVMLCQVLKLPDWNEAIPPGEMITYAVERSSNPLANCLSGGVYTYEDMPEFTWQELYTLTDVQLEAEQLHDVYGAWCDRVAADPANELAKLEIAMHKAATAVGGRVRVRPKTLIETLYEHSEEIAI